MMAGIRVLLAISLLFVAAVRGGEINTVAGGGPDKLPALSAGLGSPASVAFDSAGNLFIASFHFVSKVDAGTGIITTVAGNGTFGFSGDGGPATSAQLNAPFGVALDSAGHLYIADTGNQRIRKVDAETGIITTVAGNGSFGFSGDGGPATSAQLNNPVGVALDSADHLYIADQLNLRIRKVDAGTGIITTVAGNGSFGFGGDGGPATSAQLNLPVGVALDSADHSYIADLQNRRIRKVVKKEPVELFNDLIALVESFNLQQGIANSLDQKLQNALAALEAINAGQRQDAINKMEAFINAVEAQRDKQLTGEQTDSLIALAQEILASL